MTAFFPWRIFLKIFASITVLLALALLSAVVVATGGFKEPFFTTEVFVFLASFWIMALLGATFLAFRLTLPLRRVILKALRIASKKHVAGLVPDTDHDVFIDEPGEYYELEVALDKIRKKLKKRRVQLAHEREEAQALMTFLADAVFSLDRGENIRFFNSNFATQFLDASQVRTHSEGGEIKFTDVFRDPEVVESVRRALRGQAETLQRRMATRLDPQGRDFSLRVSPLREEKDREIYGAMAIFHDITDLKRAERVRAEFVENASHELRTPLTSIKGYLSTAQEDAEQGRYEHLPAFLKTISKNVDRLIDLVNDLLTISALESNPSLHWEAVRPEEVTEEVVERLSPLAMEKGILIKSRYNSGPFRADYKLIDQVLSNLVGNAIKYIPEGKEVEIDWSKSENNEEVVLSVRDNGQGIAEEHLNRLFERFYRVDKARSRDAGGTGLGLAIVKHIMQSHGGGVQVRSRLGEGAEFICRFPRRD